MALPAITSISPASGPTGGGTAVAIHGTDFSGATAVFFGGAEAAGVTVQSATLIDATAPPGTGTVHVTVITPAGSSAPEPQRNSPTRPWPAAAWWRTPPDRGCPPPGTGPRWYPSPRGAAVAASHPG